MHFGGRVRALSCESTWFHLGSDGMNLVHRAAHQHYVNETVLKLGD